MATKHTNLNFPPPPSCVHLAVDSYCSVGVGIVPFGFELQVGDEVMTTIYFFDTVDDIAVEEFVYFTGMLHLFSLELWAACWQVINLLVQLGRVLIRAPQLFT